MHKTDNARLTLAIAAALAIASPALAQSRGNGNYKVPPGHRPPAGMCRVWIDGVPPGHQPAPTDCMTAEATRPWNARVIYGDRMNSFPGKGKGKWKNTQRSRDGSWLYPYGVRPDQRGTVRRGQGDGSWLDAYGIRPDQRATVRRGQRDRSWLDAYGIRPDQRGTVRRGDDDDRFDDRRHEGNGGKKQKVKRGRGHDDDRG